MSIPSVLNVVKLGTPNSRSIDGRLALSFNVNLSTNVSVTQNIGGGTTNYSIDRVRSIYISNNEAKASLHVLTVKVLSTGQIIIVNPGNAVYLPLFSTLPLSLTFTGSTAFSSIVNCIVTNFDMSATLASTSQSFGNIPSFADSEIPGGVVNGVNPTFTLANTPVPLTSLQVFNNGVLQLVGTSFTLAGNTITFLAGSIPAIGDVLEAFYRF